jgi:hypothetical protein
MILVVVSCGKKEQKGPPPLTTPELQALGEIQQLAQQGGLQEVERVAAQFPNTRAMRLLAEVARSHTAPSSASAGRLFQEDPKKAVPLFVALMSPETPSEVLVTCLYDSSPTIRSVALDALTRRKERTAVPRLIELARTSTGAERNAVMYSLATIRDPRSIEVMKDFVNEYNRAPETFSDETVLPVIAALKEMGSPP